MFVGIDLHKVNCQTAVLDTNGAERERYRFPNTRSGWEGFVKRTLREWRIAIEASTHCGPVYDFLTTRGYDVTIANPREVRLISESKKKTDSFDCRTLAQLLRANFLPSSLIPARQIRTDRELHRHRIQLAKDRSRTQIRIKSLIARTTLREDEIGINDLLSAKVRPDLDRLTLKGHERFVLENLLQEMDFYTEQIERADRELKELAKTNPQVKLLLTIPGIAYYSALVIANEIGDINRFDSSKQLASFIGIVPVVRQSGERQRSGRITRQGNVYLRWILNQCVIHTVRQASPLREFYLRIKERKGEGRARVAAERKLATIIFHMLKDLEEYRFQNEELTKKKWKLVYGTESPNS